MHINKKALVCPPGKKFSKGLSRQKRENVNLSKAEQQHRQYCDALVQLGLTLIKMPANHGRPDSVFVEDPILIIGDILVVTRLRHPSRWGEEYFVKNALTPYFYSNRIFNIVPPGFIEGRDVLITDNHIYIGLSKRTNQNGAKQLAKLVKDYYGYTTSIFKIPEGLPYLKSESSYQADSRIIVVSEEIVEHFNSTDHKKIITSAEERFGGNVLSLNKKALIHIGRTKTKRLLAMEGFWVEEIDISEFEKLNGAISCLSKWL